jgi:hypothetical protein
VIWLSLRISGTPIYGNPTDLLAKCAAAFDGFRENQTLAAHCDRFAGRFLDAH